MYTSEQELFRQLRRARRIEAALSIAVWVAGAGVAALLIGLVSVAVMDAVDFYASAVVSGDE